MYIRQPAHAGTFYPSHPQILHQMLMDFSIKVDKLVNFDDIYDKLIFKRICITPHAGYIYSGIVAAASWRFIGMNKQISRIIIIGPSHYVTFNGWGFSKYEVRQTPLGLVNVDLELQNEIIAILKNQALIIDEAHHLEHSIEVQLPFLQVLIKNSSFVPILAGVDADWQLLGKILYEVALKYEDIGFVISSDFSHYLPYEIANKIDFETINAILEGKEQFIISERACGYLGIKTYIEMTKLLNVPRKFVLYLNSGDTAGDKNQVVGYSSIVS